MIPYSHELQLSNFSIIDTSSTGLDSYMAMIVIKRLEAMAAEQGKTIICTIHQPSSEVFELFDRVSGILNQFTSDLDLPYSAERIILYIHFFKNIFTVEHQNFKNSISLPKLLQFSKKIDLIPDSVPVARPRCIPRRNGRGDLLLL